MTPPVNTTPSLITDSIPGELSSGPLDQIENLGQPGHGIPILSQTAQSKAPHKAHHVELRLVTSTFTISILVFLIVNLSLSFFSPFTFDPYKFPYRGWMWWTFNDLQQHHELHNITLLGSSLMVSAVAGSEANYLNRNIDNTCYHKNQYLDDKLAKALHGKFSTYNLSAPGQMPSDAFLALKALINTSERPDVVIYGVAPRDFLDSTLANPLGTEHFRYLRRLVNVDDVVPGLFRSIFEKLEWWLGRNCYLYGSSLDLQMMFSDDVQIFESRFIPTPHVSQPFTWWDRVKLIPSYVPGEIHSGAIIISPLKSVNEVQWTDNTHEYIERYRKPDPRIYNTQFYFLHKMAQYCHRERIELIIINMPITVYNMGLLKPQNYFNYMEALLTFGGKNNVPVINLCDFGKYENSDFHDSVHLNGFGGKKFFDYMVEALTHNQRTKAALDLASQELSRQTELISRPHGENQ